MILKKISIIIPLAANDKLNKKLERQLNAFPDDFEILICSPNKPVYKTELGNKAIWIIADHGRAGCLNEGAKHATGEYLWFLHADSILLDNTINRLLETMKKNVSALYYFDLKFFTNNCHFMRFNEIGVLFRSRCLKTPFGDQAFFIKRELFECLPVYSTEVPYGEDHILVRDYQRYHIPILPIGMKILTSARKYEKNGWFKTNVLHVYLWRKQAHEDKRKHKGERKHEDCNRNILQNARFITGKNAIRR